jgi:hypothetical protein
MLYMNHLHTKKEAGGFGGPLGAHARVFVIFVFFEIIKITVFIFQNRGICGYFYGQYLVSEL